jgi:hypothetical protein
MRSFQALVDLHNLLGVEVQPAKCAVYSENAASATSVATQLGVQHAHGGLLATGTALGTAAFQEARADACADHACTLPDRMQALLDPPLGNTAAVDTGSFKEARANACADHACALPDRMQALPLLDQDCWILLHGSL